MGKDVVAELRSRLEDFEVIYVVAALRSRLEDFEVIYVVAALRSRLEDFEVIYVVAALRSRLEDFEVIYVVAALRGRQRRFMNKFLKRKRMRLKDFNYSDQNNIYFLTLCADNNAFPFKKDALSKRVIDSLMHIRKNGDIKLYCYCLMPDHLHIAMSPRKHSVSEIIGKFKSFTTKMSWEYGVDGKLWQRSFYDHIARKDEDVLHICEYILNNPVRAGLIKKAGEWPYSGMIDDLPL